MYCPKCKAEYRKGFTKCSECQIGLVPELPKEASRRDPKLKVVTRYLSRTEAELALGALQSNGIEALLFHDDGEGARQELNYLTGGTRLMVKEEDLEAAIQFLKSIDKK
jgi:hypothetical protein